jgi:uncharacterized repeat protein (TIGR03803 family)
MKAVSVALFAGMVACASVQSLSAADAVTYKEKVLYSLCSQANCTDGANPAAALIDVNGTLYGTTTYGGDTGCGGGGCGPVFSIDPNTGAEKGRYFFCSQQNCTNGALPVAGLVEVNGTLYGTTYEGGMGNCSYYGCRTMSSLDPGTGTEKALYAFCSQQNCTDGENPWGGLTDVKGRLYGTTLYGGSDCIDSNACGTVFAVDPNSGAETVAYSFCRQNGCTDGANPLARVIDIGGTVYGTTGNGGDGGSGTVFALDPVTGAETVLHSFCSLQNCTDGAYPSASLIGVKGTLYCTTANGGGTGCGTGGCGTVFSMDLNTGTETVLYSFSQQNASDGLEPGAGLIDWKGLLYGTTTIGGVAGCGSYGCGTVFSIDPNTGAETVLYSFCIRKKCKDGEHPEASLIAVHGRLYGMTSNGGVPGCNGSGCGTIFVLKKKR